MSADTNISWATKTWNPLVGCEAVSPACDHCYAKTLHDMRHKAYLEGKLQNIPQYAKPFEDVQLLPDRLTDPLSWRAPQRVFVNSMSDLFHKDVPIDFIDSVMRTVSMARRHTFMVLTKRPARMRLYSRLMLPLTPGEREERIGTSVWPLPNLMLGVTTENQQTADQRIPMLLDTPAALRFLSCEPLLGAIDLSSYIARLDLVIVGGEQAKNARPMAPAWAQWLRDQCIAAGVSFHFKQWGDWAPFGKKSDRYVATVGGRLYRAGAKRAGRELDGRTWDEFPEVAV